jgi:hypothetical protein
MDIALNDVPVEDIKNEIEKKADLIDAEKNLNAAMNQQTNDWIFNFLRSRLINIITNNIDAENDSRAFSVVFYMIQFINQKETRDRLTNAFLESCTINDVLKTNYKSTWRKCILMAGVVYDVIYSSQMSCNLIGQATLRDTEDEKKYCEKVNDFNFENDENNESEDEEGVFAPEMQPQYSSTYDSGEWVFNYLRSKFITIISNIIDVENDSRAFASVLYMIQFVKDRTTRDVMTQTFIEACSIGGKLKTDYKSCAQTCILTAGLIYDVVYTPHLETIQRTIPEIRKSGSNADNNFLGGEDIFYLKKLYDITPLPNLCPNLKPLCTFLAERVCSADIQDCLIILSGPRGSGKSISALDLADDIAKEISRLKYGDYSKANEIFNISHLASINETSLLNIISNVELQNTVLILDDGSLALNARNAMSAINKAVVDLITISRHKKNVVIITTPARSQIDINIRKMCSHYAHIIKSYHDEGYNEMYFREVSFDQEKDIIKQKNLTAQMLGYEGENAGKIKIQKWIVGKPKNKNLIVEYEKMRSDQGNDLIELTNERLRAAVMLKQEKLGLKNVETKLEKNKIKEKEQLEKKALKMNQITEKVEQVEDFKAQGYSLNSACKLAQLRKADYYKFKNGEE